MRLLLSLTFFLFLVHSATGQNTKDTACNNQAENYTYAYIIIEGRGFGKKLKVDVDLGDTPAQVTAGKEYSEILSDKKSYAAVLNHMAANQYILVESREFISTIEGPGRTIGIIFIMRKKNTTP